MKARGLNPNVHGARGLFCLLVFVFHAVNSGLPTFTFAKGTLLEDFLRSGKFGVELFFGISGIVIVGSLGRARRAGRFLYDRYARILPVLWASTLVMIPLFVLSGRPVPSALHVAANLISPPPFLDVQMLHPAAWSLGYEFTFYWLCALAIATRHRPLLRWVLIAPLATLLLALFPRALLMLAGVLIARSALRGRLLAACSRYPLLFLLLYLITWRLLEISADDRTSALNPGAMAFGAWLLVLPLLFGSSALGAIALLGIERGHGQLSRLLRLSSMQWLGTISYSFYLWHPIVMSVVKHGLRVAGVVDGLGSFAQLAFAALALPPSLLVSHLSQRYLEATATAWLKGLWPSSAAPIERTREGTLPQVVPTALEGATAQLGCSMGMAGSSPAKLE